MKKLSSQPSADFQDVMARSSAYVISQVVHTSSLCLAAEGALCFGAFRAVRDDNYKQAIALFAAAGAAEVLKYFLLYKWDRD
ncbi:hypothetical protein KFL_000620270 [Klebsormidium nitens]|uniref:Uncharacterized protein n=1 Tax=Klebsormidium nitens TaxID=105231 RepID=A0A1Y1HRS2_KLENI|nr:hypothetical protein KFL_000620270 [Klebsormidium nitens]|eukprot:GAQ80793.1 hypothetical protein KFL_000620270 [Klebsormidium nitens]